MGYKSIGRLLILRCMIYDLYLGSFLSGVDINAFMCAIMISCQIQILEAYLKFMTDTSVLLGGERNETEKHMEKVIQFEQSIAAVSLSSCFPI